jgi:UDP-3-O-[3-hydroxymyristoyl] glucosamine N-acyltransferase
MERGGVSAGLMTETAFVHPQALCEGEVGPGTRVWAFAHVLRGAKVGRDCNVGDHAFIEGGAVVGHRVTIKNQVMIWEGVTVEDDVFLGPGVMFTNDRFPRSGRMPQAMQRYAHKENWLEVTRALVHSKARTLTRPPSFPFR